MQDVVLLCLQNILLDDLNRLQILGSQRTFWGFVATVYLSQEPRGNT